MKPNAELTRTLADRAQNFTDTVPVFRIRSRSLEDIEQEAAECARRFVGRRSPESLRFSSLRKRDRTVLHLDEGASITAFHASGALAAKRGWNAFDERISDAAEEVDRDLLIRQGHEAVSKMELDRGAANEKLEFERLWQIKASGMTATGERGMTSVLRAVAAFRRVLEGLPVLGRASVFVKLAVDGKIDAWGRDWRPVHQDVVEHAPVLEPGEAAQAIVRELQTRLPDDEFTLDDFEPARLDLGYLSLGKRRPQTMMQPVWSAQLLPRGPMGTAHMIVVSAAPAAYEPICRVLQVPPPDVSRRAHRARKTGDITPM